MILLRCSCRVPSVFLRCSCDIPFTLSLLSYAMPRDAAVMLCTVVLKTFPWLCFNIPAVLQCCYIEAEPVAVLRSCDLLTVRVRHSIDILMLFLRAVWHSFDVPLMFLWRCCHVQAGFVRSLHIILIRVLKLPWSIPIVLRWRSIDIRIAFPWNSCGIRGLLLTAHIFVSHIRIYRYPCVSTPI